MTGQASWAIVIAAILAAAVIGFLLGRVNGNGARQRLSEVEEALGRKDAEISSYKREVDAHFDKTATLFVSMAGSYKNLFEHLSSGYEKLSEGSSRDIFRERVATLLLDGPQGQGSDETLQKDGASQKDEAREAEAAAPADFAEPSDADAAAVNGEPVPVRSEEAAALLAEEHTGPVVTAEVAEAEEQALREVAAAERSEGSADGTVSAQAAEEPIEEAARKS